VIHRAFVTLTGSLNAAMMLSQALYWTEKLPEDRGGWFYKSREEWGEEIYLSRYEQETARKILKKFGFWQEKEQGLPSRLWFRVDIDLLLEVLKSLKDAPGSGTPDDPPVGENLAHSGDTHSPTLPISTKTTPKSTDKDNPRVNRARDIFHLYKRIREECTKVVWYRTRAQQASDEAILEGLAEIPDAELERGFRSLFCAGQDQYYKKSGYPLPTIVKQFDRFLETPAGMSAAEEKARAREEMVRKHVIKIGLEAMERRR
jgi:hypothetical protein